MREAYAKCKDAKDKQRLLVIRLGFQGGHTQAQAAKIAGVCRATVGKYAKAYRDGGIAGLLKRDYHGGRPAQVPPAAREQWAERLKKGGFKRAKEMRRWLAAEHKVNMSLDGVYYWLKKLGGVWKVPRRTHAKKDERQAQEFKETLAQKLLALGLPRGAKVRLWVADEHRYGLISVIRRCWGLKGERVKAPYQAKYEWGYLCTALEVDGAHDAQFFQTTTVCLELSRCFLEQIAASDPEAEHVVIWDGAGFHQKAGDACLPARVHLVALPPYSPELNPVEKIGDIVKDRIGNAVWETMAAIEAAVADEIRELWESPPRVRDMIGENWLLLQANFIAPSIA